MSEIPPLLPLKLQLERRLVADLLLFVREYLIAWGRAEGLVATQRWTRVLAEMLASHYADVTRSVHAGRAVRTDETLADILGPIEAQRLLDRAQDQARRIMSAMDRDLVPAQIGIKAHDIQHKGKRFSVHIVGQLKVAWRKMKRRASTIAQMNTQEIAEGANHGLIDVVPNGTPGTQQVYKRWVTRLDERVRGNPDGIYPKSQFDHWSAHGQIVPVDQPFLVSGQSLRYPGDVSLGASIGNVINCRCGIEWGTYDGDRWQPFAAQSGGQARSTNPKYQDPRPTSHFTFGTGRSNRRATIILGTGERANVSAGTGGITIRVNRRPVASAQITTDASGNMRLGSVTVDPRYQGQGIEDMMARSVLESNRLRAGNQQ